MCIDCRRELMCGQGRDVIAEEGILILAQALGVIQRPVGGKEQIVIGGAVLGSERCTDGATQSVGLEIGLKNGTEGRDQLRATGLYQLRCHQIGLTESDLDDMTIGMVFDIFTERGNDDCEDEYQQVATQEDFDRF